MFERFTNSGRRAIVLSQREAKALKHSHIAPHHLLVGALAAEDGSAGTVLAPLGIDTDGVRRHIVATYGTGDVEPTGHIPFSDDAKTALENSLRESLALEHNYIGTEHMALGLIEDSAIEEMLTAIGVRTDAVRNAMMARLGSAAGAQPAEP
jgi:ATP-dependent Clp protease ATP-binding subunit ClpA